ncbi:MAG: outer membrane beta-barrel protein [Pseudomonadota bacterium]
MRIRAGLAAVALLTGFLAGSIVAASAADFEDPFDPITPFDWNGIYAGLFVGYTHGDVDSTITGGTTPVVGSVSNAGDDLEGFSGGLLVGYDFQFDNFVVGLAADVALGNVEYSGVASAMPPPPTVPAAFDLEMDLEFLATVRARGGFLVTPNTLIYGTGGVAFGRTNTDIVQRPGTGTGGTLVDGNDENDRLGFTVGAGVEHRFTEFVSVDLRANYTDLGSETYRGGGPPPAPVQTVEIEQEVNFFDVRFGVNVRF